MNKVICNMALTIAGAVAGVKEISILSDKIDGKVLLTIKASNKDKPLSDSLVKKLTKKDKIDLDTKDINTYLTLLLLEHYNAEINCVCESNSLEISIVIA